MPADSCSGVGAPLVSVLVPVYNVERYLERCLTSVRDQTLDDLEVVCINDGSTDGSRQIIERFCAADARFRVVDKPNSGYGASMNVGLSRARGTYVAMLESDDFYEPNALELLVGAAERNDSDVAKANFWLFWSEPQERREFFRVVDGTQAGRTICPVEDDLAVFFRKPSIWSAVYRRSFLEDNAIRFLETPGASYQDAGFNFKVWACSRRVTFLAEPVLCYRQDNEASSVNSAAKAMCVCDEYEEMERFARALGEPRSSALAPVLERMKFDSYLWNLDRLSGDLRRDFCKTVSGQFSRDLADGNDRLALFEPGARAEVTLLARDPQRFLDLHERTRAGGAMASLAHYVRLGGPALAVRVVIDRLLRRSLRRTNERGASL